MRGSINMDKAVQVAFRIDDHGEISAAAAFIAQLVREGVTYSIHRDSAYLWVTLTGGF
jgi:hypothetical protein